jgi:hypothetical protein
MAFTACQIVSPNLTVTPAFHLVHQSRFLESGERHLGVTPGIRPTTSSPLHLHHRDFSPPFNGRWLSFSLRHSIDFWLSGQSTSLLLEPTERSGKPRHDELATH